MASRLCSKYLKEQTLPKLDALQSDIKKNSKQLNKKIEKAGVKLKKCEEEAVSAILTHQKICQEMVRAYRVSRLSWLVVSCVWR
jgi:hypothetical protein